MPARLLRLLLSISLVSVVLATVLSLGAVAYASFTGTPLASSWEVVTDRPAAEPVLYRDGSGAAGTIDYDHGRIALGGRHGPYRILQALDVAVAGGLWIAILWLARRVVADMTRGRPFERRNVVRLRHIGGMLVALEIWAIAAALVFQPLLLGTITLADQGARLLPSISRSVAGARNVRIDFHLDHGLLVIGLLLIVFAAAFDIGRGLAEENEAIV